MPVLLGCCYPLRLLEVGLFGTPWRWIFVNPAQALKPLELEVKFLYC